MANVPISASPDVQEQGTPQVDMPLPPEGAFPVGVGGAVEGLGGEIGRIAHEEQQKAATDQAIKAETQYQNFVLDTHSKFMELQGEHALGAYQEAKDGLRSKRLEMAGQLQSRTAQRLFMDSSLRTWRIYESQIDTHAAQQRRAISSRDRLGFINSSGVALANLAGSSKYDAKGVADQFKAMRERAEELADNEGIPESQRDDYIQKVLQAPTDAYMRALLKGPNRGIAEQEYEKYKAHMSPGAQDAYLSAIHGTQATDEAAQIMAGIGRVDADGKIDSRGFYDVDAYREARRKLPPTAQGDRVRDLMAQQFEREKKAFDEAGTLLADKVKRQGQRPDGSFALPINSVDWADLQRLYPTRAGDLGEKVRRTQRVETAFSRRQLDYDSKQTRGRAMVMLYETNPEELKLMSPESLEANMRADNPGVRDPDIQAAQSLLKHLQTNPLSPIEKALPDIVRGSLLEGYKGDRSKVERYRAKATDMAHDMIEAKPDIDRATLHQQLVKEYTKPSFWESRSGENYVAPPRPAAPTPAPTKKQGALAPGWYKRPGYEGRQHWNGLEWK